MVPIPAQTEAPVITPRWPGKSKWVKVEAIGGSSSADTVFRNEPLASVVNRDTAMAYRLRESFPTRTDILISHEAPVPKVLGDRLPALSGGQHLDDDYEIDRKLISRAWHYLQPTFHGFWSIRNSSTLSLAPHDHTERVEHMTSLGGSDSGLGTIYDAAVNTITKVQVV